MFFAVFFTIFLGSMLEEIWGSFKLTLYIIGGVASVVISEFLIGFPNSSIVFPTFLIIESILFACAVYNPNYVVDSSHGNLFVDLDNDGDQDLVSGVQEGLLIMENNGVGVFSKRVAQLLLEWPIMMRMD